VLERAVRKKWIKVRREEKRVVEKTAWRSRAAKLSKQQVGGGKQHIEQHIKKRAFSGSWRKFFCQKRRLLDQETTIRYLHQRRSAAI